VIKLFPYILFEKYICFSTGNGPRNQHCASCIGTLSFPIRLRRTRLIATDGVAWSMCLDIPVNPAKTGESIEMPLGDGGQTRVGPINRVSNRWCNRASVLAPPGEYDGMICEEAAMHTIATITVATCC